MRKTDDWAHLATLLLVAMAITAPCAWSELPWAELRAERVVSERDWLALRLEVLGQGLSFPAYRVHLTLDADRHISFDFLASSGLAEHLTEQLERTEAEEIFAYHAQGIRDQVETLLQEDFPGLWLRYDAASDFRGEFLGPGRSWSDPPVSLGYWRDGRFQWKQ